MRFLRIIDSMKALMVLMKAICILLIIAFLPINAPVYAQTSRRIPVLLYHHLLPQDDLKGDNAFTISVEDFSSQMAYLRDNGYTTVTLNELYAFLFEKKPLPEKSVMITFDDGYYSNVLYAYPILKEYGFTAVIFHITSKLTERPRWLLHPMPCSFITVEDMENTKDVVEYATHTHDMHFLKDGKTALVRATYNEVVEDIQASLKKVDNQFALAYPHGQHSPEAIAAIREAGIEMAFTIVRGYVGMDSDPYRLNRFVVYKETALNQIIGYLKGA